MPLREGYVPVHKGAKRQQVRQQTSNQVRMDVNTVAWSSTTRMKTGRIHSNIICSNTQHNVSNGQQTMNLSGMRSHLEKDNIIQTGMFLNRHTYACFILLTKAKLSHKRRTSDRITGRPIQNPLSLMT